MALAQENILDFEQALEMPPTVLEAFIRVVNKRSEEQEKEQKKREEDAKKNTKTPHKKNEPVVSEPPPPLGEKEKEKLKVKLDEFKTWMDETNFKETYFQAKAQAYAQEEWQ